MKIGADIVQISRFGKKFQANKEYFEEKVFLPEELADIRTDHLAGIFAAKEAVVKALGIGPGRWKEIAILQTADGKPFIHKIPQEYLHLPNDLSISHDGDYAVALAIFHI